MSKNWQKRLRRTLDHDSARPEDFVNTEILPSTNARDTPGEGSIFGEDMQLVLEPGEGEDKILGSELNARNIPWWRGEGRWGSVAKPGEFSWTGGHHMPTECELGVGAPPGCEEFILARDNPEHPLANTRFGQKNWWKTNYIHPEFGNVNYRAFRITPEKQKAEWAAHRLLGNSGKTKPTRITKANRNIRKITRNNSTRRKKNRSNNTRKKNRSNTNKRKSNKSKSKKSRRKSRK
jgi:hypothetical protein